ncbi:MAG: hypothetical protein IT307_04985 [Chloroflexi bacterium]|nr:hypothetical protein [Chloroflexota bacterium]
MTADARELLLAVMRFFHATAAIAVVGSGLFGALALADGGGERRGLERAGLGSFRELVDLSLIVFAISGGILTFDRLSSGAASTLYVGVLGAKLVAVALMYTWAFQLRRASSGWNSPRARRMVGAGLAAVLLASVLKTLWESALHP